VSLLLSRPRLMTSKQLNAPSIPMPFCLKRADKFAAFLQSVFVYILANFSAYVDAWLAAKRLPHASSESPMAPSVGTFLTMPATSRPSSKDRKVTFTIATKLDGR